MKMKWTGMLLMMLAMACSKAQMPAEPTPIPGSNNKLTLEFSVAEDTVVFGQAVGITWQANGSHVVIDQGVGNRGPVGAEEVHFANPGKKMVTATAYGDDGFLVKRDSVFIKEAPAPVLPMMMLSATKEVMVDTPATICWVSQNADYVVVDYVTEPEREGTTKVTFSTPGIRIVTATAFNGAGYVSARDTIDVVESPVKVSVDDIVVAGDGHVRADQGEAGYVQNGVVTFEIPTAGRYQVFAEVWYNSGDSQVNESFYLQIRDESGLQHSPLDPNAGVFYVVPDDPGKPHTASRASGIFNLKEGRQSIDLYHYAKIAHVYPQFINGEISGPESVKIMGFRLEFLDD